jgi:hypothetical protein
MAQWIVFLLQKVTPSLLFFEESYVAVSAPKVPLDCVRGDNPYPLVAL